eukprot:Tamp_11808.p3 GENE.Tamp_11808~~Tamp_11808.p3  ORF type:complete len:157 (+),score=30.26 Tamp_11808:926-1396(+)
MKVLYGNQSEHNIRYLLQGTKSTSRLEVAVKINWVDEAPKVQDGTLFHSASVPARQEILQHKDTSAHESIKDDSFDSFSQAAREDEEEASTIGGDWNNFRMDEVAGQSQKDKVQEAVNASHLPEDENKKRIEDLVDNILGEGDHSGNTELFEYGNP